MSMEKAAISDIKHHCPLILTLKSLLCRMAYTINSLTTQCRNYSSNTRGKNLGVFINVSHCQTHYISSFSTPDPETYLSCVQGIQPDTPHQVINIIGIHSYARPTA